jgi:uncharacterized protein YkwD
MVRRVIPHSLEAGVMPIHFRCRCGRTLQVADVHAGRQARCRSCQAILTIPRPEPAVTAEPIEVVPLATPKPDLKARSRAGVWLIAATTLVVVAVLITLVVMFRRPHPPALAGPAAAPTLQAQAPADTPEKTPPKAPDKPRPLPADLDTTAREALNRHRALAGVPPVELDPDLSAGCQAHAKYLLRNAAELGKPGFRIDDEDPKRPGFSEEGQKAAKAALCGTSSTQARDVIDQWMASVFFRIMLLDPELNRIGWGQAEEKNVGSVGVLDVLRGRGSGQVVIYPADGQKDVPLAFPGNEVPDPIPQAKEKKAGYPVTVTFPRGVKVQQVAAKLIPENGKELPAWLSTPDQPAQDAALQMNSICLIAREPLLAKTKYKVEISAVVNGEAWSEAWQFTTGDGRRPTDGIADVLQCVNFYRKAAGLEPVESDPGLSKGCQAHAEYLVKNAGHPSTQGLGAHDERADLPGFTPEGQRAGKASDISIGIEPQASVDGYMSTFFHRVPILDPELRRVGFGSARDTNQGWIAVLDVQSGRGGNRPIIYPVNGQKDVPRVYLPGEVPDPIPESKDKKAGYPLTVTFPRSAIVKNATALLKTAAGQEVPAWVSTPEKTVHPGLQRNTVCLIAREPLKAATAYSITVEASVDGKPWSQTWSFTTAAK